MGFKDFVKGIGKKVGETASDFGKKASDLGGSALSLGKKAVVFIDDKLPDASSIAGTVEDVSGAIAKGAGMAAAAAAATGIGNAGLSEALAGVSGLAYGINKGAGAIKGGLDKAQDVSGAVRKGIERVK